MNELMITIVKRKHRTEHRNNNEANRKWHKATEKRKEKRTTHTMQKRRTQQATTPTSKLSPKWLVYDQSRT